MNRYIVSKRVMASSAERAIKKEKDYCVDSVYIDEDYEEEKEIKGFNKKHE